MVALEGTNSSPGVPAVWATALKHLRWGLVREGRYSEPDYVQPAEWVLLSTNYTDFRLNYQVLYGTQQEVRTWNTNRLPLPTVRWEECSSKGFSPQLCCLPRSFPALNPRLLRQAPLPLYVMWWTRGSLRGCLCGCV